jgi:phosphoserine phosphatase
LCGLEGIDWLAARRGGRIAHESSVLTQRAMDGEIPLDSVYGSRLKLIRPTLREIAALSAEYRSAVEPHAVAVVKRLREAGVHLFLISGGIRRAIEPLAIELGIPRDDLFAVELAWDAAGEYVGFDTESPLTTQAGKLTVARALSLERPALGVGDGATDAAMRPALDAFAAFTGYIARAPVVRQADHVVDSFTALEKLVLG